MKAEDNCFNLCFCCFLLILSNSVILSQWCANMLSWQSCHENLSQVTISHKHWIVFKLKKLYFIWITLIYFLYWLSRLCLETVAKAPLAEWFSGLSWVALLRSWVRHVLPPATWVFFLYLCLETLYPLDLHHMIAHKLCSPFEVKYLLCNCYIYNV